MKNKNQKPLCEKVDLEKALIVTTSEIHFGYFPVFCISSVKPSDTNITYEETRTLSDGSQVGRRWQVSVDIQFGWPGEYDAQVWRAIEHILHLRKLDKSLSNPFNTTFAEIYKYMRMKRAGGSDWARIEESLSRMTRVTIRTDCWYYSEIHERKSSEFHLINSYHVHMKRQSNGNERRNGVTIELSKEYFSSINQRYVRPLDKGFRDILDRWIAKRLYEILSSKFYGIRNKEVGYHIKYSRLCALLGSIQQPYLSYAKRILGRAHKELLHNGFLGKVEWRELKIKITDENDWVLVYWPGAVANAQLQKNYWNVPDCVKEPLFIEEMPETKDKVIWLEESDESDVNGILTTEIIMEDQVIDASIQEESNERVNLKTLNKHIDYLTESVLIRIYEKIIGPRRMQSLSDNEKSLLDSWKQAGVVASDVEQGIQKVISHELDNAKLLGKDPSPIWSLSYCAWGVWEAFSNRQRQEQVEKEREQEESEIQRRKEQIEKEAVRLEEKRKSYSHTEEWSEINAMFRQKLNDENYGKVTRRILASKWEGKTLCLLARDGFCADWFQDEYLDYLQGWPGTEAVKVEAELK